MNILGISAFYHDSAACLVRAGRVVAAAQEERFTRVKHDASFPTHAAAWCLEQAGLHPADLDVVAYYDKPLLKFERLLETSVACAPRGFGRFRRAMPVWLKRKLRVRHAIAEGLGHRPRRLVFPSHHESHAASAFFPSPFDSAAILTCDGVGEWATATVGRGQGGRLELTHEQRFPHSLGLLYSAFTAYCGFRVNHGEYKLMGLAPFGEPRFLDRIRDQLVALAPDGSLQLDLRHFAFTHSGRMTAPSFDTLFEGPARQPGEPITRRHADVARSIQAFTEEAMLAAARFARQATGEERLVMAGGVALNCVANGRIAREAGFDQLWVQPAAGDAGGALGAGLFAWHQLLGEPRVAQAPDGQRGSLLGPSYSEEAIADVLAREGAFATHYDDEAALLDAVAERLDAGDVVGHFSGAMEFGPRALGARSILADPRRADTQRVLNAKIKFRESFRPFAPAVLSEHAADYFELEGESPYMLVVAPVRADHRVGSAPAIGPAPSDDDAGLHRVHDVRSTVPAVTHVDGTARIQTVDETRHPRFARVLRAFHARTGLPMLVNTSFNVRGEPIVATPGDALRCFRSTNMDVLVLERFLLRRDAQPGLGAVEAPDDTQLDGARPPSEGGPEWDPPAGRLRAFGVLSFLVFGIATVAAAVGRAPLVAVIAPGCLAIWSLGAAIAQPAALRGLWRGLTALTWPIGVVLSTALLGVVFVGLLTPIGLVQRLAGRDALGRRLARGAPTHWRRRAPAPPAASYLRPT